MSPKRHEESMKDYLEGRSEGFYDLFQNRIPNTYNKYKEDAKDWLHAGQLAGMGLTLTGPGAVVGVPLTAASTAGLGVINGIDGLVNLSKGEYIKALGNFGEIGLDLLPARAFTKLSTKALPYTERTIIRGNKYYRSALRNVRNVVNGVPTTSNANVYLRMKASDIIGVSNIGMRYIGNAGMRAVNNYIQTTPGGQLTPLNPNTHHLTGDVTRMTDFTRPDYRFRDAFNKGRMGYDVFDGGRHYYDRYINNNNPTSTTNNDDLNKR